MDDFAKAIQPVKKTDNIEYTISNDPKMLEQYYRLRDVEYKNMLHIDGDIAEEDTYDRESVICLAVKGDIVIGGARATIIPEHSEKLLPLEEKGFTLKELLPELELDKYSYCETSRFVVHPDFRFRTITLNILKTLYDYGKKVGCVYHFSIAPKNTSINSQIIGKMVGVDHHILNGIKVPYKPMYGELNEKGIFLSCNILFQNDSNSLLTNSVLKRLESS